MVDNTVEGLTCDTVSSDWDGVVSDGNEVEISPPKGEIPHCWDGLVSA